MTRTKRYVSAVVLLGAALARAAVGPESPGDTQESVGVATADPQNQSAGRGATAPEPALVPGFEPEEASRSRTQALLDLASRASDERLAATLRLAAVNMMLAEQLDAPCSRRFMRTGAEADQPTVAKVAGVIREARSLLDSVGKVLDEKTAQTDPPDQDANNAWRALKKGHASLGAFLNALDVLLLRAEHDDVAKAERRAALGLAPLLESDEPETVAAAGLFYAVLRADEDSNTSALSVLPPVLQRPPDKGTRFAYYARLLRCRLIARRSSPPAALTLLLQLEDGLDDWFHDGETRSQATIALASIRAEILGIWKDRLGKDAPSEERRFIQERIDRTNSQLAQTDIAVLQLGKAIPSLVEPPP